MILSYFFFLWATVWLQLITEFLPISSSTHVYCLLWLLNMISERSYNNMHFIAHPLLDATYLSSLVAIIFFYVRSASISFISFRRSWLRIGMRFFLFGCVIDGCTFCMYLIKDYIVPQGFCWSALGLLVTMCSLLSLKHNELRTVCMTWQRALLIGVAQSIAFFPGISRFAFVFAVARLLGFSTRKSFDITWLYYMPLMAAVGLRGLIAMQTFPYFFMSNWFIFLIVASCLAYGIFFAVYWCVMKSFLWLFCFYLMIPISFCLIFCSIG